MYTTFGHTDGHFKMSLNKSMHCPKMNSGFCMRNRDPSLGGDLLWSVLCDMSDFPYVPACCPLILLCYIIASPDGISCIYRGQKWWPRHLRQRLTLLVSVGCCHRANKMMSWCSKDYVENWGLGLSYIWSVGISQRMNLCQPLLTACRFKNPNSYAKPVLIITEEGKVDDAQVGMDVL